ncbi:MAG: aminoacetone oxidase family FAD-binding enzyme [Halobacteriovoraceae bacterium]|nr:aminoacetone oxidase family FAD-binding enzyme [Halobacteriovoraceae bacterium]|tara:strand:+ start:16403 stop:17650 length:1248 start_codon:yes stop_codon:yes gene_type:complete
MSKIIAIIGGGASGFFAAIQAAQEVAQRNIDAKVHLYESSPNFLSKVRISGGGRCNVTHHQYEPKLFCQNYPRGARELRSPFTKFQALNTVEWFKARGVTLVAESDGRMFPSTNTSETIIECFIKESQRLGVVLHSRQGILSINQLEDGIEIQPKDSRPIKADQVLVATGSSKRGYELAKSLGHTITELAPSLFSFKIKSPFLRELSGVSFENASLTLKTSKKKFQQNGPLLITHHGLSGPAVLKLSAWAAREMKKDQYKATLLVNWSGLESMNEIEQFYLKLKTQSSSALIKNTAPSFFTKRFWANFIECLNIPLDKKWSELSKKDLNRVIEHTKGTPLEIQGQNRFKEEFVECGGVKTSEVDFKTMQSKIVPGLHFSGEILDIDGITGGFNFQNAWTTGYLAGTSMAMGVDRQ